MDQREAPLVAALAAYRERGLLPFHTPGHKQGRAAPPPLDTLWGPGLWQTDLTEVPGLDDLHAPRGVIKRAQELAARAFGAEETFFLVNGSSAGVIAMIGAVCNPGDEIILPRNCHRSVTAGLVLSGAVPVYLAPPVLPRFGIPLGIRAEDVEDALAKHPRARAVLVVTPSYYGICSDLEPIAAVAHGRGIPLLVDGAHGPHLGFHPALPAGALAAGADMVVHSTHKVLTSLTQSSLLHLKGRRIDRERLVNMLRLVQTSSPSYPLLASLDACRRQMALRGRALLDRLLAIAREVRERTGTLPGIEVLGPEDLPRDFALDPTRLTVGVQGAGFNGPEAAVCLREQGVQPEMADPANVVFILTVGDDATTAEGLARALAALSSARRSPRENRKVPGTLPLPPLRLPPREAVFAPRERVPLARARSRIAGEALIPYPPGIPLLNPGEEITPEVIAAFEELRAAGVEFQGVRDPEGAEIAVLKL
ncbi:MAG: aminotransferase class I/II-fold pyridoxal phosphate-dependent enzyme [bacterium]|jgi:arginine decarboxylase